MQIRGTGHLYLPTYRTRDGERRHAGVYWWKIGRDRVSTGCRRESDAQAWVVERLVEMRRGHLAGVRQIPIRWDELERMLEDRWKLDGRRGMSQCRAPLRRLRRAFAGWEARAITTDQITRFAVRRRTEGAAAGTVNLELAILRRAFTLAREAGRLDVLPIVHRLPLPPGARRTGTVERGDLEAIMTALPEKYRAPIRFLYCTGWREGEALNLVWSRVDLKAGELRLDTSKTGEPRVLQFGHEGALAELLRGMATGRQALSPYVFPGRAGARMDHSALQRAWRAACAAAGMPGKPLIHDLRRTGASDLMRAGVPLAVAMSIVGHRSLSIHQGYSIVAGQDQEDGLARLEALRSGEPVQRRLVAIDRGGQP